MAGPESTNGTTEETPTSSTPTPPSTEMDTTTATATPSAAADGAPSTSSPSKPVDPKNLGVNFLLQGKRHLVTKDFSGAIESLGEACRLFTEVDPSVPQIFLENAEAHFFYGKALLEQSRLELGVLEGVPEQTGQAGSDSEDDQDTEGGEEDDASSEDEDSDKSPADSGEPREAECTSNGISSSSSKPSTAAVAENEPVSSSNDPAEVDLAVPSPAANPPQTSTGLVVDSEQPSTSSGGDLLSAEDELTNLELAWQVLELAKIRYSQLIEDPSTDKPLLYKRLADTHCTLGEVATESENYTQAIDEFNTGLEILSKIESSDSREIAQYHFQMGLAFSFDKKFPEAIASFKKSVEIIENRISLLKTKIAGGNAAKSVEEGEKSEEDEVQELTALLPELQEKIQDTIDAEKDSQKMEAEEEQEKEIIARNSPVKNPNPANNINHLVKKKKKAEDAPENERPVKKLCTTAPEENGTSEKNGEAEASAGASATPAEEKKNGHAVKA